jgi:excisionase family DNA binding protein
VNAAEVSFAAPGTGGQHPDRLTLTVEETAEILGISRALAYEAVRRGEIPHLRIGRRIVVPVVAVTRLIESATTSALGLDINRESQTGNSHPTRSAASVERDHTLAELRPDFRR